MGSGGWIVVLVILALALTTGFVVSANDQLTTENHVAHAALVNRMEAEATMNAKATSDAQIIDQLKTQLAERDIVISTAEAAEALATQQAALTSPGTPVLPMTGIYLPTPTPMPNPLAPAAQANILIPTLGLGLFAGVVVAIYRLLKIEDRAGQAQGAGARAADTSRTFAADEDAVYVKMSRREASSYARDRSKK